MNGTAHVGAPSVNGTVELSEKSPSAATIFHSPERRRWEADVALGDRLIQLLLSNRFEEAEAIAEFGMAQPPLPQSPRAAGGDRFRDTRGAFAMYYARAHTECPPPCVHSALNATDSCALCVCAAGTMRSSTRRAAHSRWSATI